MNSTPRGSRKHIIFYGKRNVGKSSIMNKIIGQEISLVSDVKGTTTDPVSKAMELIPFGPVVFMDTGGIDDTGKLGDLRVEKTINTLDRADCGIYVMDVKNIEDEGYLRFVKEFKSRNIPYITVINKMDLLSMEEQENLKKEILGIKKWKDVVFTSIKDEEGISCLKDKLIEILNREEEKETFIGDIVSHGGKIVLVIPVDGEAPKGRLILPQVQILRDALDHGIKSYVVRDTELLSALEDLKDIDLLITDSQIFKEVDKIVPKDINLTSFSILMARQKGDLDVFLKGIEAIEKLKEKEKSRILIMESCTHNTSHEDIGRVKIPKLLNKYLAKELEFDFAMGQSFPKDLKDYDLVIHCGSCMLNKRTMINRIKICKENDIPMTNYGIVLAYLTGILDRAVNIFKRTKGI